MVSIQTLLCHILFYTVLLRGWLATGEGVSAHVDVKQFCVTQRIYQKDRENLAGQLRELENINFVDTLAIYYPLFLYYP